jgi:uncharacterized protein
MQFNVADLLKEHVGAMREYDVAGEPLRVGDGETRVSGHVRFDRTPDGILVRAQLRGAASCECSRCLAPVEADVEVTVEEEYIPKVDILTGARVTPPEGEDEAYRISERHVIDLAESAAEYWAMALPMAPVCRDACAGLCPECGAPAGDGHGCVSSAEDARWSKLRDLKLG